MKKFLLFTLAIVFTLTALTVISRFAMSEKSYFRPGSAFFPLQKASEQQRLALTSEQTNRASYLMSILERRAGDLQALTGTPNEVQALAEFHQAFQEAVTAVWDSPLETQSGLKTRLAVLVYHVKPILAGLQIAPDEDLERLDMVKGLIGALEGMVGEPTPEQIAAAQQENLLVEDQQKRGLDESDDINTLLTPQAVEFPAGSGGVEHSFFSLTGKHSDLECEKCHIDGRFDGTPTACMDCHLAVRPTPHFEIDCVFCHSPEGWDQIIFDHALTDTSDCASCHEVIRPVNHYSGQCSACHQTTAWEPAQFDHAIAMAKNCQGCHASTRPVNHFSMQCSACHRTAAWVPANFNHVVAKATNCQSCHTKNRPANHYTGQCSACHQTSAWRPANFNHAGQTNCQGCHLSKRPANHYSGQCSSCHTTTAWKPANFNHSGQTDCQSCHADDRPNNHYSGQCSNCHNQTAWKPANFNHSGQTNCQSCHNPPGGHWSGECSKCHTSSGWSTINTNWHSFPVNHKGADGKCSKCHPSNSSSYTCYSCHDKAETEKKHNEEGISDIAGRCASCHPNGNGD